jgi:dihydroorotate dehydrogenase (fumarate)
MSNIDVSVVFADGTIRLPFCLYNASGPRSGTVEALQKVASSKSGAVLTKSATLLSQNGNPLPRTHHTSDGLASFNSEGLPNNGIDYYIASETMQSVMDCSTSKDKPYIVSLSGKCLADNLEMIRRIADAAATTATSTSAASSSASSTVTDDVTTLYKIASIELNLACPNVIGKPIIGYDMNQMNDTLQQVANVIQECNDKYQSTSTTGTIVPPLGIKLPPYLDFSHFHSVTEILNKYSFIVKYVVSINTVGNALCIDGQYMETPYICSNNGFAGLSGPAIKYTALANVRKLREWLLPTIDIIGVGGISTGQDVYDMILCGATACQVATIHWKEGPICFDRIYNELIMILQQKGYTNIQQVHNRLQLWSKDRANIARQQQYKHTRTTKAMSSSSDYSISNSYYTDSQFYKTMSIALIIVIAILISYEIRNLLPTE